MRAEFRNEPVYTFEDDSLKKQMAAAIAKLEAEAGKEYDLVIGGEHVKGDGTFDSLNPSDKSVVVGRFQKGKAVPWKRVVPLLIPIVIGAALGAWVATETSPDLMRKVFAGVLLLVAASVMLRPGRWIDEREAGLAEPWRSLAFLGIGSRCPQIRTQDGYDPPAGQHRR